MQTRRTRRGAPMIGGLLIVVLSGLVALVVANREALARMLAVPSGKRQTTPPQAEDEDEDQDGPTRAELYREAQRLDIAGRSRMSKSELEAAVRREN